MSLFCKEKFYWIYIWYYQPRVICASEGKHYFQINLIKTNLVSSAKGDFFSEYQKRGQKCFILVVFTAEIFGFVGESKYVTSEGTIFPRIFVLNKDWAFQHKDIFGNISNQRIKFLCLY